MEISNFSLNTQLALGGIKKAIPNMIYGNTLFIISLIVCALIYPIHQPHGLPDPSFPLNAGTAIIISTLAGAITGMQLTKDFLKSNS